MTVTKLIDLRSNFKSDRLTADKREELAQACDTSKRTTFYDLSQDDVIDRNHYTLENLRFGVVVLDWACCIERLGLIVSTMEVEYQEDEDGSPILDEKTGEPKVKSRRFGPHDFSVKVTREGLTDFNGAPIPKGNICFTVTKEATNRPRNETNFKGLTKRFDKWAFNGETLIKDANGVGASEQHRLIAKAIRILTGQDEPDDDRDWSFFVDGIHPDTVITIDTGKANTGKDIFGSDPEIVPPEYLLEPSSIINPDEPPVYVENQVVERVRACGVTESASKLCLLRLGGKNVNASLGSGNEATERAHLFASRVCPDIDQLATRCHLFIQKVPSKERPVSASELTAALSLWYLRTQSPIDTIPRSGVDGGTPLDEVEPIRFDLDKVTPLLTALAESALSGPLHEWSRYRCTLSQKKENKQTKFAQLCVMVDKFLEGEEVTKEDCNKSAIGGVQSKKYWHFGGADRGPIVKVKKGEAE